MEVGTKIFKPQGCAKGRRKLLQFYIHASFFTVCLLTLNTVSAQSSDNNLSQETRSDNAPKRLDLPPNIISQPVTAQPVAPVLSAFPEQANQITSAQLAQYIRIVLDRNPQLLQSEAKNRASDYLVKEAEHNRYPKLVVSGDMGREQRDRSSVPDEDFNRAQAQLRLVMPLYDPEVNAKIEQRGSVLLMSGWALTDVREQLALRTIEAYSNLVRATRSLELVQQSLKRHRQYVAQLKDIMVKHPERKMDAPLATARVSKMESLLAANLRQLENARSAWWRLTGLSAPTAMMSVSFAHLPETLDGALDMTYQNNAVLKLAQAEIEHARSGVDVSVAAYKPKVNIEARSRTGNDWNGVQGNQSRNYVGVTFEWQAFSGFANSYASKAANENVLAAQYAYDDVRQGLRVSVEQEWFNLQSDDVALKSYQTYVQNAQNMAEIEQNRFIQGQSSLLTALDTEKELLSARLDTENVKLDMALASWRLLALQGRIQSVLDQ